jgi:SAM-dependent methyltransferase
VSICRKFGLNVNLHTNTEKLPYKNYSFDIVILNEVLEHLKNPTKTLNEVKRILKNRGTLVITTPNCGFLVRNLHPTHISEMTYKDLEKLIRPLGFEVINHEVRGFGLYDFLGRYAIFPLGKRLAGEKLLRKSIYAIRKKADSGRFSRFRKGFVWFGSQQLLIARSE